MLPEAIPFEITTNEGNDVVVDDVSATLEGKGWIDVREIRRAGGGPPLEVTWTDGDRWQVSVPITFGDNLITLEAYDFSGNVVGSDTIRIGSTVDNTTLKNSVRVSEINFHPHDAVPDAGEIDADAGDFEFIELTNVGSQSLDLDGVQLDGGIRFTFASQILAPRGRTVVVKDRAVFASRYGSNISIAAGSDGKGGDAGEFGGHLSNAGESITVLNAGDQIVQQFEYDDWYAATDGEGSSLEIIDPTTPNLDAWNRRESWRASAQQGGTPGSVEQGLSGDMDRDGNVDLSDVTSFAEGLIDPQEYVFTYGLPPVVNGDVDGDGDFDFDDIAAFVELLGVRPLTVSSVTATSAPRDVLPLGVDGLLTAVDRWTRIRQASTDLAPRDETFRRTSSFSQTNVEEDGLDAAIPWVVRREWLSGADRLRWTWSRRRTRTDGPTSMEESLATVWSDQWDWLERSDWDGS